MKLTFASGTGRQQTQWRQALNRLLSLPMNAVSLSLEVSFVDPSEVVTGHATDLAITTWAYGSTSAKTKVRNDAPGYGSQRQTLEAQAAKMGLEYNADLHFNETAVHEFGHALYAALPEEHRVKIAEMFGAKSDSLAELQPVGVPWEDQIIEGIAETVKEAFLPRRFRVFPNRTNRSIPYSQFPAFRQIFRHVPASYNFDGLPHGVGPILPSQLWRRETWAEYQENDGLNFGLGAPFPLTEHAFGPPDSIGLKVSVYPPANPTNPDAIGAGAQSDYQPDEVVVVFTGEGFDILGEIAFSDLIANPEQRHRIPNYDGVEWLSAFVMRLVTPDRPPGVFNQWWFKFDYFGSEVGGFKEEWGAARWTGGLGSNGLPINSFGAGRYFGEDLDLVLGRDTEAPAGLISGYGAARGGHPRSRAVAGHLR